jgi:hypothetical protein
MFGLPFAGEGAVLLFGAFQFARIAALIGTTADVAFAIYATTEDPEKGPLAFLAVLLTRGPRNSFLEFHWRDAALGLPRRITHARAHLDIVQVVRVGALFVDMNDKMQAFMPWEQCPK